MKIQAPRGRSGAALRGVWALVSGARLLGAVRDGARPLPRAPYVQNVSATSAVIAWGSPEPGVGLVEYGESPGLGRKALDLGVDRRHAVTLSGLEPGSTYHYRVAVEDGEPHASGRFRTAPLGRSSFAFAVIGDSGDGKKGQLAVASLLERLGPDLVLHTGDVVYPSGEDRHYDRRFFAPYGRLMRGTPIFPSLGNHDLEKGDEAAYFKNFFVPQNGPRGTGRCYSFDWGDAHFVALNSEAYHDDEASSPEEQRAWLERDLAQTRRSWKFVFFHRPLYSSSDHGGDEEIRRDLEPVLARHGVAAVFNGHDHDYERTNPIRGVTYVVSGGGGKDLYPAGKSEWTAASASAHHAVLARLDGDRLFLEAIRPDGTVLDRAVIPRPEPRPEETR